jgi:hypothetical protein
MKKKKKIFIKPENLKEGIIYKLKTEDKIIGFYQKTKISYEKYRQQSLLIITKLLKL